MAVTSCQSSPSLLTNSVNYLAIIYENELKFNEFMELSDETNWIYANKSVIALELDDILFDNIPGVVFA